MRFKILCLIFTFTPVYCFSHEAHEHGVAHIDIAYAAAGDMMVNLTLAGADVYGFEHTASTAEEKKIVLEKNLLLQKPIPNLFFFEEQCQLKKTHTSISIDEDAQKEKKHHTKHHQIEHNNILVSYEFFCPKNMEGTTFSFDFKKAFPHISSVRFQVVGDKNQNGGEIDQSADGHFKL